MPKNQTVRKSDNQEVKEETFIQTSRKGGHGQLGREDSWKRGIWRTRTVKVAAGGAVVPHLCADKLGGKTGEQNRLGNPRLQCVEIKPQNL